MEAKQPLLILVLILTLVLFPGLARGSELINYKPAEPGYSWEFPRDHGVHPQYRTEWWYFTGRLLTERGETLGYQFTIFRSGIGRRPTGETQWSTDQVYLGHIALSRPSDSSHWSEEMIHRQYPGLAGSSSDTSPGIRLRNWAIQWTPTGWIMTAKGDSFTLKLELNPTRNKLFQGPGGYSKKGPSGFQASQYYSFTRVRSRGNVTVKGDQYHVTGGYSWFDHEFGSSQLSKNQTGWDWISLRLSDGSDLMVYRLRESDGSITPQSHVALREPGGEVHYLDSTRWTLTPTAFWRSPRTQTRYPLGWKLEIPSRGIVLRIKPLFKNQEMRMKLGGVGTYWEGMIEATGQTGTGRIQGEGYLELTGYSRSLGGMF